MKAKKSVPKVSPSLKKKWLTLFQNYAEPAATTGLKNQQAKYRIVVDTNVLVSALLYGGRPASVLEQIIASHTLVLSDYIVDELVAYLKITRPKVAQKWIRGLRDGLQNYCYEYDADSTVGLRDPKDNPILALARSQHAIIVTGDRDLLEHSADSKVAILSIAEFEELLLS